MGSNLGEGNKIVIFCRDDIVEKRLLRDRKTGTAIELRDRKPGLLETTSAIETRQEAIRINLLQIGIGAIYHHLCAILMCEIIREI